MENEQLILQTLMEIKDQLGTLNGIPERVTQLEITKNKQSGAVAVIVLVWTAVIGFFTVFRH
jgi:uncharacterized BrkB/YihY/UPF0761 family membrane protein